MEGAIVGEGVEDREDLVLPILVEFQPQGPCLLATCVDLGKLSIEAGTVASDPGPPWASNGCLGIAPGKYFSQCL